jgi:hypothetical protein
MSSTLALSIVLPFADDEERVGEACRRLAAHCRALGLAFELVALDEGSGDNSHAVLALLRAELPELRVVPAAAHRAFAIGTRIARGRALLLIDPAAVVRSLAPLARALGRLAAGADLVILPGRFVVAQRTRVLDLVDPVRARGAGFERRLARRALRRGRTVEIMDRATTEPRPAIRWPGRGLLDVLGLAPAR